MRVVVAVIAGLAMLAGCSAEPEPEPPPEVTFAAEGATVTVKPTQYCERGTGSCTNDAGASRAMRVPAGKPLKVAVPDKIADAPWVVVFKYRTASGAEGPPSRSAVFKPGTQHDYTLNLPAPTDQLEEVQVQRIGHIGAGQQTGDGLDYLVDATWILAVDR
jgi:uncharacterized protein DUF2771